MCGEAVIAARPRQRSYSSTTEKMSGSSDVYGRHQFRMQKTNLSTSGISKRKRREREIVTGGKVDEVCVNGALEDS